MSQLELRAGLADVPVAESAVSFIDGKRARLEYRGIAVETLARESCFEETAWLLLKGDLPTQRELANFDDQLRHHRRIKYKLLDLISFLTAGEDECRAWPIRRGLTAPKAAAKIHSDIERGFIRAEVVRWDDLVHYGSEAKCRGAGKLRSEGKEYVVQDGDVINFRFNV